MSSKPKTRKSRRKAKKMKENKSYDKINIPKGVNFRENVFAAPKAIATGWNTYDTTPSQMSFNHKTHGKGLRVTGSELFCKVDANAYYAGAFYNYLYDQSATGPTPGFAGWIALNPLMIAGIQQTGMQRLALLAIGYSRYRYRKITFEYIPTLGTDQSQSFMFGVFGGFPTLTAGQAGSSSWFYDVSQLSPSMAVPSYGRGSFTYTYDGDMTWQTNPNKDWLTSSDYELTMLVDLTTQCTLAGAAFFPTTFTPTTFGMLRMSYEIELFNPTAPQFNVPTSVLLQVSPSLREKVSGAVASALADHKFSHLTVRAPLIQPNKEEKEKESESTLDPPPIPERKERLLKDIPKSGEASELPLSRPVLRRS